MSEKIERTVIESYAKELADIWVANLTLSGAMRFKENEAKREALVERTRELGIWEDVYERAAIMMGAQRD